MKNNYDNFSNMEKGYLEFLNALCDCLKKDNTIWYEWMEKSKELYREKKDLSHFLSAFGGMGSFNDYSCENKNVDVMASVLKDITYSIANALNNEEQTRIEDILSKEYNRYIDNFNNGYGNDYMSKKLEYLTYIVKNHNTSNLHDLNTSFLINKNNNTPNTSAKK